MAMVEERSGDGTREPARSDGFAPLDVTGHERLLLFGSLTLGIFWAIQTANPERVERPVAGLLLLGVLVGVTIVHRWRLASWATLAYVVAVGLVDRIHRTAVIYSDVMNATREAILTLAHGQNPYTHYYVTTSPHGSGFGYPPGEIIFYAIPNALFGHVQGVDRWAGVGVVLLLAALAFIVGPGRAAFGVALYATFSIAAFRALDGSNDTGLAFLIVLAVILLAWSERYPHYAVLPFYASAVIFAWALLFKQFAWLIYPFVLLYLWRRGGNWRSYTIVSVGLAVLVALPFFVWSPGAFTHDILVGGASFHRNVWGINLWAALADTAPSLIRVISPHLLIVVLVATAGVGLAMLTHPASNLAFALLQGLALLFVYLFLSRWTTQPYYTFAGAILALAVTLLPVATPDREMRADIAPVEAREERVVEISGG